MRRLLLSLSYVRSGIIYLDYGTLWDVGINGHSWSDLARPEITHAYILYMDSKDVNPSPRLGRDGAFPSHGLSTLC